MGPFWNPDSTLGLTALLSWLESSVLILVGASNLSGPCQQLLARCLVLFFLSIRSKMIGAFITIRCEMVSPFLSSHTLRDEIASMIICPMFLVLWLLRVCFFHRLVLAF